MCLEKAHGFLYHIMSHSINDLDLEGGERESAENGIFRRHNGVIGNVVLQKLMLWGICMNIIVRYVLIDWLGIVRRRIRLWVQTLKDVPLIIAGIGMTGTTAAFALFSNDKNAPLIYK